MERFINLYHNSMPMSYEILDLENALPSVNEKGEKRLYLHSSDIKQYLAACHSIKSAIKAKNPDMVLCAAPEAYTTAKIVSGLGLDKKIGIIPSLKSAREDKIYEVLKTLDYGNGNDISISIIECWQQNLNVYLDIFLSLIAETSYAHKNYNVEINLLGVDGESYHRATSSRAIIPTERRQVFVNWSASANLYAAPKIFSAVPELIGVKYAEGKLTKVNHRGELVIARKPRNSIIRSDDVNSQFINTVLKGG